MTYAVDDESRGPIACHMKLSGRAGKAVYSRLEQV